MTRSVTAFFNANTRNFVDGVTRMDKATDRFTTSTARGMSRTQAQMLALGRAAAATFGAFSTAIAVRELGTFAEASTRVGNLLRAAGDDSDAFKRRLLSTAIESRAPIVELANALLRLQKADPTAGLERNLARVATFQRLSQAGGRTSSEASSAALQLSQAIQSGRLQGDEFRSLSENAPIEFLDALAARLGVARSELKALSSQGKITADDLTAVLDGLEEPSKRAIENLELTISAATTNVRSAFTVLVGELDESLGATEAITSALSGLTDLFVAGSQDADRLARSMSVLTDVVIALAGGRGLAALTNSLVAGQRAANDYLLTAKATQATDNERIATSQRTIASRRARTAALILERRELERGGATRAKLATAQVKVANGYESIAIAQRTLETRQAALARSTDAVAAAQARANIVIRAGNVAWRGFQSIVTFLGGPVGALVTLGFGIAALASSGETAAESIGKTTDALNRLSEVTDKLSDIQGTLETDTDALKSAEERLKQAIESRSTVAQTAAQQELASIRERIAQNRELLDVILGQYQAQLELSRQNAADATRNLIKEGQPGIFGNVFDFDYDFRVAAQERAAAFAGGAATLQAEFDTLQQRLTLGEALSRSDRDRFELLRSHLAKLDEIKEREETIVTLLVETAAQRDIVGQHMERNRIASEAVTGAVTRTSEALDRVAKRQETINALTGEQARLEAELTAAKASDDVERTHALQIALSEVNAELERQNPIVQGSKDQLQQMLATVQALIAGMDAVEFDGDKAAYNNAVELEAALQAALAQGQDVGALDLSGFVSRLYDVQDAAYGAADALAEAAAQARRAFDAASRSLARAQNRVDFADDPVGLAVADFNVDNPLLPTRGPDDAKATAGVNGEILATRELIRATAELEQSRRAARSGGGGGRTASAQEAEDLKTALQFIESMKTAEERRADQLVELAALRERLVTGTAAERAAVDDLSEAMERLGETADNALGEQIYGTLIDSIKAGDSLSATLKNIGLKLLELEGTNFLSGLFGATGDGNSGTVGFGLGKALAGAFTFADGGVMTSQGQMPLRKYARGGVATSPQLALFGEGSGPEAFVPLASGAIPVRLDFANLQMPNLDAIKSATKGTTSQTITITDNSRIEITGNGLDKDEILRELVPLMNSRDVRLVQTIREINEDDPRYLR